MTKKVTVTMFTPEDFADMRINLITMFAKAIETSEDKFAALDLTDERTQVMGSVLRYEAYRAKLPLTDDQVTELKRAKKQSEAFKRAVAKESHLNADAVTLADKSSALAKDIQFSKSKTYAEASEIRREESHVAAVKAVKHANQYVKHISSVVAY